jgi:hypothetical protein
METDDVDDIMGLGAGAITLLRITYGYGEPEEEREDLVRLASHNLGVETLEFQSLPLLNVREPVPPQFMKIVDANVLSLKTIKFIECVIEGENPIWETLSLLPQLVDLHVSVVILTKPQSFFKCVPQIHHLTIEHCGEIWTSHEDWTDVSFPSLETLSVVYVPNELSEIQRFMVECAPGLKKLHLNGNSPNTYPDMLGVAISRLANLEVLQLDLDLSMNTFERLVFHLRNSTDLREMEVSGNTLSGERLALIMAEFWRNCA